ncbi:unnamed protein product [Mytilus edulis]|uniref:COR domain-containing protein n=1 Tax=Mytilus edulis TaxID=6550 RepID=A0A8S3RIU7_MYTED|nr:unnamed protein product [Mytilus edulis]
MRKLAQNNSIEEDELLRFLNNQHKIKNVIFFNDLKDYIILQPDWLVKCFRCLVNDHQKRTDAISFNACQTLKTTGELSETLIDRLFQKEPTLQFGNRKRHLLRVMEKFDIIVQPLFRDTDNDICQKSHLYYLPCMIKKSLQFNDIKKMFIKENVKVTITPWLVFEFKFLPLAFFNHILFYYVRNYTVCKAETGYPALYLGKAVFYVDRENLSNFIICFSQNAISLQVWNWRDVDEDINKQMLSELCNQIEHIRGTLGQNLSYNIKAKCSLGDFSKRDGRISLTEITNTKHEVYFCEEHQQKHSNEDIEKTWLKHDVRAFNFISNVWYGNISDRYNTKHTGFVDGIKAGDDIMADKGSRLITGK